MKDFFSKTWVKITAWVMIALGALVLIISGVTATEIAKVPALVAGIIQAIGLLILFIKGKITGK